jgi:hypothetical protein
LLAKFILQDNAPCRHIICKISAREIDPVIANKNILSYENQLLQIRNNIPEFPETNEPSTSKRRKTDKCEEYAREAKEVCDIIVCQAKERFSFTGHLIAATLFFPEKHSQYSN